MSEIGDRIREEREALGMSQTDFGKLGSVGKNAQSNYENGTRKPTTEYLEAIGKEGADVAYILTGKRISPPREMDQDVIETLESRGITIKDDKLFGARVVTLSSAGMAWMLNYVAALEEGFAPTLTWGLLTDLACFEPDDSWRPMRMKAAGLPVSGEREYFVYFLYLDGTPPRQVHLFQPDNQRAEDGMIRYSATRDRPFRIADDQDVVIQLSSFEVGRLESGSALLIDPVNHGEAPILEVSLSARELSADPKPGIKPRSAQASSGQSKRSASRETP